MPLDNSLRPENALADWGMLEEKDHKTLDDWRANVVQEILRQLKISEQRTASSDVAKDTSRVGLGFQMFQALCKKPLAPRYPLGNALQKYDHQRAPSGRVISSAEEIVYKGPIRFSVRKQS